MRPASPALREIAREHPCWGWTLRSTNAVKSIEICRTTRPTASAGRRPDGPALVRRKDARRHVRGATHGRLAAWASPPPRRRNHVAKPSPAASHPDASSPVKGAGSHDPGQSALPITGPPVDVTMGALAIAGQHSSALSIALREPRLSIGSRDRHLQHPVSAAALAVRAGWPHTDLDRSSGPPAVMASPSCSAKARVLRSTFACSTFAAWTLVSPSSLSTRRYDARLPH